MRRLENNWAKSTILHTSNMVQNATKKLVQSILIVLNMTYLDVGRGLGEERKNYEILGGEGAKTLISRSRDISMIPNP